MKIARRHLLKGVLSGGASLAFGPSAFAQTAAQEKSLIFASVEVSNVQGLFKEFKARGVEFAQTLKKQAWGGSDFQVRDPDGNTISFVTYG